MSAAPGTHIPKEGIESPKANKGVASPKTDAMKAVALPKTAAMKKAIAAKASAMKAQAKASVNAKAGSSKVAEGVGKVPKESASPVKGKGSAGKDDEGDANPIKMPAAAKGSVKDLNKRLLEADAGSDKGDDAEEEDGEGKGDVVYGRRDQRKNREFLRLLSENKLPSHIMQMWLNDVDNETFKMRFKTMIVNNLFVTDSRGTLIMTPDAPFFISYKQTQERKSFRDTHTGLPRGVFRGLYFQNSEEALQEALDNNEVEVVTFSGKDWYTFSRPNNAHDVFKLGTISDIKKTEPRSIKHAAPLVFQDAAADPVYVAKVEPFFTDAKAAFERLLNDVMELAPLVSSDPKHSISVLFFCIVLHSAHTSYMFCCV